MSDTTSQNFGFILPEPNGSDFTWGNKINTSLTLIDLELFETNTRISTLENVINSNGGTGQILRSDSPSMTGNPTAPTQPPGNNSTRLATTAFVFAAINNNNNTIRGNVPNDLNTLQKIAAAIGNDANYAQNISSLFAAKANLASPIFTGSPRVPTPALSDFSTKIANTEFSQGLKSAAIAEAKAYTDLIGAGISSRVAKSGDTMSGDLTLTTGGIGAFIGGARISASGVISSLTFGKVYNNNYQIVSNTGGAEGTILFGDYTNSNASNVGVLKQHSSTGEFVFSNKNPAPGKKVGILLNYGPDDSLNPVNLERIHGKPMPQSSRINNTFDTVLIRYNGARPRLDVFGGYSSISGFQYIFSDDSNIASVTTYTEAAPNGGISLVFRINFKVAFANTDYKVFLSSSEEPARDNILNHYSPKVAMNNGESISKDTTYVDVVYVKPDGFSTAPEEMYVAIVK